MATDAPPANFSPCTFGRYSLLERLAVGGMAEIFRAKQLGVHGFEKILVIKRILPHLAADPEFLAMFVDEAKLQCALQHPKIVHVLEFGQAEGQYYIALEYVEGMDALGLLRACAHRRQRMPVRLAVHIVCEVLDALDYAHTTPGPDGKAMCVVHRDVSPSNILISRRGDVKLGDFGIARAVERTSKTQSGTLKGKYGYMAPEQVIGSDIDGRTDLFAVGIVLAEMLMGRRLFTAPNDLDVLLMVRDARLDRLDRHGGDIPPSLRAILNRLLARDPAERYPTARATREALQEFLFEMRQRVSVGDLGAFLETLRGLRAPIEEPEESGLIMLGEDTRARQKEAEQQRLEVVRASQEPELVRAAEEADRLQGSQVVEMIAGSATTDEIETSSHAAKAAAAMANRAFSPLMEPTAGILSGIMPSLRTGDDMVRTLDDPDQDGSFEVTSPARLFARLATERATGELVMERESVVKEIFLVEGVPEFVSSNVPSERFGEYLVGRGVISPGELSMALAILPRFQGKLGDTLVGLNLLRPLEVFRHLTRQVREKIIQVFGWSTGSYRFFRGRTNQREAFPLGLDAFEILGAGVAGLQLDLVRSRLNRVANKRVKRLERAHPTPEQFRVGAGPRELWQRLDGRRTVHEWIRRYDQPDQLVTLCRTLYLLIEAELVTLE